MTKNIKVTDNNGYELGYTYPKRAKGLIKNGRAQYVDDCTIRLSKVASNKISEAEKMKYILLNTHNWTEKDGVERSFIDGFEGKLEEIIQLGTWDTEAVAESNHYLLDAGEEYSLVFWLNGGENEKADEICELLIYFNNPNHYKNRYKLNRNYIKPLLHHSGWELYSIQFSTPSDSESVDVYFSFRAKKAPMAVKAAKEPEYYKDWKDELDEFADKRPQRHNIVFEDGWPSIYMYGGNKYSTEVLRKIHDKDSSKGITNNNFSVTSGKVGRSFNKFDIDFLEDTLEDIRSNYDEIVDCISDIRDNYEDLLDRCDDNSFSEIKSEIISDIEKDLSDAEEKLSRVTISEYEDALSSVSTEMDFQHLDAMLSCASDFLVDVESIVDELESRIDDFNDEIDEMED